MSEICETYLSRFFNATLQINKVNNQSKRIISTNIRYAIKYVKKKKSIKLSTTYQQVIFDFPVHISVYLYFAQIQL